MTEEKGTEIPVLDPDHVPAEPPKEIETPPVKPMNPTEVTSSDDGQSLDHNGLPIDALVRLQRLYPFARLLQHWADREGTALTPQRRVSIYHKNHPVYYHLCRTADFIVTLAITIIIIASVLVVLYKTLLL